MACAFIKKSWQEGLQVEVQWSQNMTELSRAEVYRDYIITRCDLRKAISSSN